MHAADDDTFVSLADFLRPPVANEPAPEPVMHVPPIAPSLACSCTDDVARDVRLFRARLADAFDERCERLVHELAYAVLGREMLVAPVDLAGIVARIVAEHPDMQPLRVRVSPCDAQAVGALALPAMIADAALAPGDAIVELTGTSIDARLGIRLCALLNAAS